MMKNSKGMVTVLRRLLLLSGLAFAVGMSGCGSDADNGAANKPEATEAPEDAGANDETVPSGGDGLDGFFTFTDDKFYLTGLEWLTSTWEDVKSAKGIQAEDIIEEHGIENYVKSDFWSDVEDCEVQEVYFFTEDDQLYSGKLSVKASTKEAAQSVLSEIVDWTKTSLPAPVTDPEKWERETQEIVDEYLNLADATGRLDMWDMRTGNSLNLDVASFEGSMIIDISTVAPRDNGGTVQRSITG